MVWLFKIERRDGGVTCELRSNSRLVCCAHFRTNALRKRTNPSPFAAWSKEWTLALSDRQGLL